MFSLPLKDMIYVGVIIAILGSTWYMAHNLYDKYILLPKRTIITLEANLNTVGSKLNVCHTELDKKLLSGYLEALGENNDEDIVIDFSNISY